MESAIVGAIVAVLFFWLGYVFGRKRRGKPGKLGHQDGALLDCAGAMLDCTSEELHQQMEDARHSTSGPPR